MSKSEVGEKELLFLDYANNSFRKDPQYMPQYLSKAIELLGVKASDSSTNEQLYELMASEVVSNVEHFKGRKMIPDYAQYDRVPPRGPHVTDTWKRTVYTTAYGFNSEGNRLCDARNCRNLLEEFLEGTVTEEMLQGYNRLLCYECDQLTFINVLGKIIEGKDFTELITFYDMILIQNSFLNVVNQFDFDVDRSCWPYKSNLRRVENIMLNLPLESNDFRNVTLRALLTSLSTYSLTQFLLNNDRRRIKRCQECSTFFISKTNRKSKYCTDACRNKTKNREWVSTGRLVKFKKERIASGKAKPSYHGADPNKGTRKS